MLVRQVECTPTAGRERREYELTRSGSSPTRLWYEVPAEHAHLVSPSMDHVAVGVVMLAMRDGDPLTIDGPVSAGLVANLQRYQELWEEWVPHRYRRVDIVAPAAPIPTVDHDQAVALFSGGVDATWMMHAALHDQTALPTRTAAVMVRGMGGFQPGQVAQFTEAFAEADTVLRPLGIDVVEVSTNWEQVMLPLGLPVLEIYITGFVSCLHFAAHTASRALVASAQGPGRSEKLSCTPAADVFLSSDTLKIVHLGAGLTRPQKLADLHRWHADTAHLRVCNRTLRTSRNCGVCEKCVRTAVASQIACVPLPGELPPPTTHAIRSVDFDHEVIRNEWQQLADEFGPDACVPDDIRRAVRRHIRWFDLHLPTRHGVRRFADRAVGWGRRATRRLRHG